MNVSRVPSRRRLWRLWRRRRRLSFLNMYHMLVCIMCGVVANVNCSPFRSEKIAVTTAPPPSVIGGLLRMMYVSLVIYYGCV